MSLCNCGAETCNKDFQPFDTEETKYNLIFESKATAFGIYVLAKPLEQRRFREHLLCVGRRNGGRVLDPTSVDNMILIGDGRAVVRGEEEDQAGNVMGHDISFQALPNGNLGLVFGRHP